LLTLALMAFYCPRPGYAQGPWGADAGPGSVPRFLPIWEWELPGSPSSDWHLYLGTSLSAPNVDVPYSGRLLPPDIWNEPFESVFLAASVESEIDHLPVWFPPPEGIDGAPLPADSPVVLYSVTTEGLMGASYRNQFWRGWTFITGIEVSLLAITMMVPKDWTGWHDDFIQDGVSNIERAWSNPPTMDDDWWFHNWVGHPYGGAVYYNTVRSQGSTPAQGFIFSAILSAQWEYAFEAVAEQPSIQDLIITPTTGAVLGELIHRATLSMKKNGTTFFEKAFILIANPTHVVMAGWN
jgi:hypothetical protein